jgi:hypothetical protein
LLLSIVAAPLAIAGQQNTPTSQNAVPLIDQPLQPTSIAPGAPAFKMTVNGAGFASGAVVKWNGSPRATQFVSAAKLTASILASDVAKVGTASISVVNPSPGGGKSNAVQFPVADQRSAVTFTRDDYTGANVPVGLLSGVFSDSGALDLVASNSGANTVSVFLGDGQGSFGAKHDYAVGVNPGTAATGDFNGDGILDLVVPNSGCALTATSCPNPKGSVSILLGNGDGTFKSHVDYPAGIWTTAVMVGDFNGDGKLDVIAVNGTCTGVPCSSPSSSISVLLGNGDGTFKTAVNYAVGLRPIQGSGVVGDFNGDGKLDVAVANNFDDTVSVLLGNGDGTFQKQKVFPIGARPVGMVAADFNNDGKLDLAVANEDKGGNTFSVLLGNGDGTFKPEVEYATGSSPHQIALGDFNGDGILDVVLTNTDSSTISLFIGKGDGTFQPKVDYGTATTPVGLVSGDFDGDGRLDVAVAAEGASGAATGTISVLLTAAVTPTVEVTPSLTSISTTQALKVTVVVAGGAGRPTPTGSATLTGGGYTSSATLSGGGASFTIPAGKLATGKDTLTTMYTPDSSSSSTYSRALGTAMVTVKAAPIITWATPTAIAYGTALSATQLDASSKVAGKFAYSPPAGTLLPVGSQTLSVTFTPTDTTDYGTATATVTLNVHKAVLTVTAINQRIASGSPIPVFTYAVSGFLGGASLTNALTGLPSLTTTASVKSPVGTYPINVAIGTLAATNYSFMLVNGTLTITK